MFGSIRTKRMAAGILLMLLCQLVFAGCGPNSQEQALSYEEMQSDFSSVVQDIFTILNSGKAGSTVMAEGVSGGDKSMLSGEGRTSSSGENPTTTDAVCFSYEELPDGTLRITGYDEEKNTQNPYQVVIPAVIDGKQVSVLGKECLGTDYAGNLLELTISDGITTLEENIIENAGNISLVILPDSVTSIDPKAFWRNDCQWPVAIACKDTSYAYQYAKKNAYACRVMEHTLPENDFLDRYREGTATGLSYFAHFRTEGERHDYITVEYRDREIGKRLQGEVIYQEPNEFLALVLDKTNGDILQCIDSSDMDPEKTAFYLLHGVTCRNLQALIRHPLGRTKSASMDFPEEALSHTIQTGMNIGMRYLQMLQDSV